MLAIEKSFRHGLYLWMPRKLWHLWLFCPHPDYYKEELPSAGVDQRMRQNELCPRVQVGKQNNRSSIFGEFWMMKEQNAQQS
ncbi:hypothetical protein MHYP_G00251780 [Metynnis hypsauchen]